MARNFLTPILLPGDPTTGLQAATKQYFDNWKPIFNVKDYGAVGNVVRLRGISATSTSPNVTVSGTTPASTMSTADIGKTAVVYDGNNFVSGTFTTISNVVGTTVTLNANAGITVSGTQAYLVYGTDDSAAAAAAATAATNYALVDTALGPNSSQGLGQPLVYFPATTSPGSGYMIANQTTFPSGVRVRTDGMIFSGLSDRYAPALVFNPYSAIDLLLIDCLFGAGIQLGSGTGVQAGIHAERLVLWHVGTSVETSGALRSQDGVALLGYGFPLGTIWMKGGRRGVYHNAGSDCIIAKAHLIGCKMGVWMNGSNEAHYSKIILDTCGDTVSGNSGIVVDNGSSMVSFNAQAFEVSGSTRTLDNVVLIGAGGAGNNTQISFHVTAQKTGGNVINFAKAQDVKSTFIASNTNSTSNGGSNITTAVVFGTIAGGFACEGVMNSSITPYSGNVAGTYRYTRSGVSYQVEGGTAPSGTPLAANGTSAPGVSVTGNDHRGKISFGSGTAPASGNQVSITFSSTTAPVAYVTNNLYITLTPLNSATALLNPYIDPSTITTTGFSIGFGIAPIAAQTAGTYALNYKVDA